MQGHATSHATFRDSPVQCYVPNILCVTDSAAVIKKLEASANNKNKTGYMSNNAVSDFAQPDWEGRTFNFKTLYLDNADFSVARNAQVSGNIDAKTQRSHLVVTQRLLTFTPVKTLLEMDLISVRMLNQVVRPILLHRISVPSPGTLMQIIQR